MKNLFLIAGLLLLSLNAKADLTRIGTESCSQRVLEAKKRVNIQNASFVSDLSEAFEAYQMTVRSYESELAAFEAKKREVSRTRGDIAVEMLEDLAISAQAVSNHWQFVSGSFDRLNEVEPTEANAIDIACHLGLGTNVVGHP